MVVVSTNKGNDMNESTLVPREEMSDLDWLARNVHVWPAGDHQPWCYVYMAHGGVIKASGNFLDAVAKPTMITIYQWLDRRAELQNKPSWNDAPKWANFLSQGLSGTWFWHEFNPELGDCAYFSVKGKYTIHPSGETIGDWRDTLEKRPEQAEFEPFVSVEDAKISILQSDGDVKESGGIIDRSLYVGKIEDAATAKQPAPKGSGNPILGMVLADLTNRALEGKEKYGEPLLAHNGRNALWDLYQELLDAAMYIRQAIEEQKK